MSKTKLDSWNLQLLASVNCFPDKESREERSSKQTEKNPGILQSIFFWMSLFNQQSSQAKSKPEDLQSVKPIVMYSQDKGETGS